jgi:hypothetical protein
MSAFGWRILYIVSIFLVFLSICFISSSLQLIIPKLHLIIGTASAPIAVSLFLAFSSDFSAIITIIIIIIIISSSSSSSSSSSMLKNREVKWVISD